MYLDCESMEFAIACWSKMEIYDWRWSKHFRIQLSRILLFNNLFEQNLFKSSEDHWVCYRTKSQNNCLFTLQRHHAMVASFFPTVHYATSSHWHHSFHNLISLHSVYVWSTVGYTNNVLFCSPLFNQMYAKGVYFCSFVTKPNQACTKYSPKCIKKFL